MDRFTDEQLREFNDAFAMFDGNVSTSNTKEGIPVYQIRDMFKTIGMNPTDNCLQRMTLDSDRVRVNFSFFKSKSIFALASVRFLRIIASRYFNGT